MRPFALLLALFPLAALASTLGDPGWYVDVTSDVGTVTALSGLAAVRGEPNGNGHDDEVAMWGVSDDSLSPSRIHAMTVSDDAVRVVDDIELSLNGAPVTLDCEGIDEDPTGGWWIAVEGAGNAPNIVSTNRLVHVEEDGTIDQVVELPAAVASRQVKFGFEGVAVDDDGGRVFVAFQGEWGGDPTGYLKIGQYTPATGDWVFFHYPRSLGSGRVGISEITWAGDDTLVLLERDNLVSGAWDKRLYAVSVAGVVPAPEIGRAHV